MGLHGWAVTIFFKDWAIKNRLVEDFYLLLHPNHRLAWRTDLFDAKRFLWCIPVKARKKALPLLKSIFHVIGNHGWNIVVLKTGIFFAFNSEEWPHYYRQIQITGACWFLNFGTALVWSISQLVFKHQWPRKSPTSSPHRLHLLRSPAYSRGQREQGVFAAISSLFEKCMASESK